MTPISLQLYTLREMAKDDLIGTLGKVAEIGYTGVEMAGLHGHEASEVRKVLDDLGMVCSSSGFQPVTEENVGEAVDLAKALGCNMFMGGWKREEWGSMDGIRRAAEAYQKANALLAPHGLRICYHNHWWEMSLIDGKLALEHFLELAPNTCPQIDAYWACNFGAVDVPALVGRWAARVPMMHMKDGPLVEGEPHTACGAGKMDLPAVVAAADPNVLKWLIVELDHCATDMLTAVKDSYEYLTGQGIAQGRK